MLVTLLVFILLPPSDAQLIQTLDAMCRKAFPADGPGASVLVKRGDTDLIRKGYGLADMEWNIPLTPDTVFRVGSITKQFTGAAMLLLVEQGKVKLDEDIRTYLPDYPDPGSKITVEMLLAHTSGIPNFTDMASYPERMRMDQTLEEMTARWSKLPLEFKPGTRWNYSNSAYYLAGVIIEKVSGQPYDAFVEEHIFKKLGMKRSYYGRTEQIVPNRARGYSWNEGRWVNSAYVSMTQPYAAGSILSTVEDLATWSENLPGLLKPESIEDMFTARKLPDGSNTMYGLGWVVREFRGAECHMHDGGINGFNTVIMRIPEKELLVVVLANLDGGRPDSSVFGQKLAAVTMGAELPEHVKKEMSADQLERYVGMYHPDTGGVRAVGLMNGELYTQRDGGNMYALHPAVNGDFFWPGLTDYVRFNRKDGKIIGMTVHRLDGRKDFAKRGDEPGPEPIVSVEVDPVVLKTYRGLYELTPNFKIRVTLESKTLHAQATNQPRFDLLAQSRERFLVKGIQAAISFQKQDGKVIGMILHQGGRDQILRKIK
ncbi:MAG: serine hydrolase [Acidobacteriota bacterium]|nr:serine hydrolase [Acidobacteriota bacterium]